MVRTTLLALNNIDPQLKESGLMSGCTERQLMWKVLIPVSKPTLLIGVNQVIMLSLNMVIIASMIGAGGLGYDVLASLRRLDIGGGIESGIAIVVIAIALDRLSQSFANLPTLSKKTQLTFYNKYKNFGGDGFYGACVPPHLEPPIKQLFKKIQALFGKKQGEKFKGLKRKKKLISESRADD